MLGTKEETKKDLLQEVYDAVVSKHRFMYAYGVLYEHVDNIWVEVEDHLVQHYLDQTGGQNIDITIRDKSEFIDYLKSHYLVPKEEIQRLNRNNLVAFNNCYIDTNELRETGEITPHYFIGELFEGHAVFKTNGEIHTVDDEPIFFSRIPHNLNLDLLAKLQAELPGCNHPMVILSFLCPTIASFFADLLNPEPPIIQLQKVAYCFLRANPYKVFFIELGEHDAGKTTYMKLLRKLIGERNITEKSLQDLANYPFSSADLYGKLLNLHDDLTRGAIHNTGLIKQLTGESVINAHRKFREDLAFLNYAKLIFTANQLPKVKDLDDDAFFSRVVLTQYKNSFPRSDFAEKLLSNETELEGLIIAALFCLRDLMYRNAFEDNFQEYSEFWKRHTNSVYDYILTAIERKELVLDPQLKISKKDLYGLYAAEEKAPVTQNKFTTELSRLFNVSGDAQIESEGRRVWAYRGIGIPVLIKDEPSPTPAELSLEPCSICSKLKAPAFLHILNKKKVCTDCLNGYQSRNDEE